VDEGIIRIAEGLERNTSLMKLELDGVFRIASESLVFHMKDELDVSNITC
jgi:hypothetical protein